VRASFHADSNERGFASSSAVHSSAARAALASVRRSA
jgi:hypothetical protein